MSVVGQSIRRIDALGKVTGTTSTPEISTCLSKPT